MIEIHIATQTLCLKSPDGNVVATYLISTAKNGVGEISGSEKTPRGRHIIGEKIGDNMPMFTVFHARKPTGEIYSAALAKAFPDRDWILSRILWLSGSEEGFNCGGDVDTRSRFIYIHGTHDEENMGTPRSHGCIRMRNRDVMQLFDQVSVGHEVLIIGSSQ